MRAHKTPAARTGHGILSATNRLISDTAEGSIMTIIGAVVFALIGVGAVQGITMATADSANSSVNAERLSALNIEVTSFKAKTWAKVIEQGALGLLKMTDTPADLNPATPAGAHDANINASTPFPYFSKVSVVNNANSAISTPGGPTNSDGSYKLELLAPKLGAKMSDCSIFPTLLSPTYNRAKCIYVVSTRAPRFADAAAIPSWKGLVSTSLSQVSGVLVVDGPGTVAVATVNTCEMGVKKVRVSFRWTPTIGNLNPISTTHNITDGRLIETIALSLSSASGYFSAVGDFNRGSSSVCGGSDKLSLIFSGAGKGTISALLITPVAKTLEPGSNVPGVPLAPKLQIDRSGIPSIVWNKPTDNTSSPAITYNVTSQCQPVPYGIPASSDNTKTYDGGILVLPLAAGETLEQHIERCPVYRITPMGANGEGVTKVFALTGIDAEYTGILANISATTNQITVDYTGFPIYIKNRINKMTAYICYERVSRVGEGCIVAPIKDLINATAQAPTIPFLTAATSFVFASPPKADVKNGAITVQLVTENARQATKSGSNVISIVVQ